jgi:hypothetical protein
MKKLFVVAACAIAFAAPSACLAGPFGFHYGETLEEVTHAVGASHIKQGPGPQGEILLDRAPLPHPGFESYALFISPTKGLLKIAAIGKDIATNRAGDDIRQQYADLQTALSATYGVATSYDNLTSGSIWTDPNDWTMSIIEKDRAVESFWTPNPATQDHLTAIELEVGMLGPDKGYFTLFYEYEGWDAYADSLNTKKNSVL